MLSADITAQQYDFVSKVLYDSSGITLGPGKASLVKSRLGKRLRALNLESFDDYLSYVKRDSTGKELAGMIDALTTNKTSFFREEMHFRLLQEEIIPQIVRSHSPVRLWSAGCSSGEEPFSVAISLHEGIRDIAHRDVRILATDISPTVLQKAQDAVYHEDTVRSIQQDLLVRHFAQEQRDSLTVYRVRSHIRKTVSFAQLNLLDSWPMRGPFDTILCRNVMIYFDKPTREGLVQRFYQLLRTGGYLFTGHSESLNGLNHEYHYIQPAVYRK